MSGDATGSEEAKGAAVASGIPAYGAGHAYAVANAYSTASVQYTADEESQASADAAASGEGTLGLDGYSEGADEAVCADDVTRGYEDPDSWAAVHSMSRWGAIRYLLAAIVVALAVFTAGVRLTQPRTARVMVIVTSIGNVSLDRFTVVVDGQQRCTAAPCTFHLEPGLHGLRAWAEGYVIHESGIAVAPGSDLSLSIKLNAGPGGAAIGS